jgi:hypothetical protein
MSWFNLLGDAKDLASEFIEDKDKSNELTAMLEKLGQEVYMLELQTKTIPWVDAAHKMSRPIISVVTMITAGVIISLNPDLDIPTLLTVLGGGGAPAAIYTAIKGKGN